MAIITTGKTFGTTDPVTSVDLNNVANAATFNDPVDETSLELITSGTNIGKLHIKDGGVTKAKIENVANLRVLGNTSGSAVAPQEVEILDDDTMATADAATLATSESIKAYVDSNGITKTTGTAPYFGIRAWAHYNQVTDTVEASQNIASIVRTSTGYSTVTFTEAMPSDYYAISIAGNAGQVGGTGAHTIGFVSSLNASTFTFGFFNNEDGNQKANNSIVTIIVTA